MIRSYYDYQKQKDRRLVISSAFFSSLILAGGGLVLCFVFSPEISQIIFKNLNQVFLLKLIFIYAFFSIIKSLIFVVLRAKKESRKFCFFSLIFFLIQLVLVIFLVTQQKMGIRGVIWGGLITSGLSLFLLIDLKNDIGFDFSFPELKKMLSYSIPFVPDCLAALVITSADRFFLVQYSNLTEVGWYSLGYKFGMLIAIVLIEPFRKIWDVMIFSVAGKRDMNKYYSKMLTYFLLFGCTLVLLVSCPAEDILKIVASPEYLPAYKIVPLISLSYLLLGVNIIWGVGYLLKRKTKYVPIITIFAAGLNVILNYFLVPPFGMMGAAVATLISYFSWAVLRYFVSKRFYYIPYEWKRITKILSVAAAIFFLSRYIAIENPGISLAVKLSLGASLSFWLFPFKFYSKQEKEIIYKMVRKFAPGNLFS